MEGIQMKVIVAGPRDYYDYDSVCDAIEKSGFDVTEVVSGNAKGVDTSGERWAFESDLPVRLFKADWKNLKQEGARIKENTYGKYNANAGSFRNGLMAEYGDALVAIIVNGSFGTANMVKQMKEQGKPVYLYDPEDHMSPDQIGHTF
jgi:hypothetical protein